MKATKVNAGLAESNGRLLLGLWRDSLHVTCGLTVCTPGPAPGPTLSNEYVRKLYLYYYHSLTSSSHWSLVHSEVYRNKYVVSVAPFSTPACPDCSQNITQHRKQLLFACFRLKFFIHFSRGSADPICPCMPCKQCN